MCLKSLKKDFYQIDNYVELKPSNVECSIELKPSIVEASIDVKPPIVDSIVSKHSDHEVNKVPYFSTENT